MQFLKFAWILYYKRSYFQHAHKSRGSPLRWKLTCLWKIFIEKKIYLVVLQSGDIFRKKNINPMRIVGLSCESHVKCELKRLVDKTSKKVWLYHKPQKAEVKNHTKLVKHRHTWAYLWNNTRIHKNQHTYAQILTHIQKNQHAHIHKINTYILKIHLQIIPKHTTQPLSSIACRSRCWVGLQREQTWAIWEPSGRSGPWEPWDLWGQCLAGKAWRSPTSQL